MGEGESRAIDQAPLHQQKIYISRYVDIEFIDPMLTVKVELYRHCTSESPFLEHHLLLLPFYAALDSLC